MTYNYTRDRDIDIEIAITPYNDTAFIVMYPSYKDGSIAPLKDSFIQSVLERARVTERLHQPCTTNTLQRLLRLVIMELDDTVSKGGLSTYLINR